MKKEVMRINNFSICPICHHKLGVLKFNANGYSLREDQLEGTVTDELIFAESTVSISCPYCKFNIKAKETLHGLVPIDFKGDIL